jgi:hypothetical protein
VSRLVTGRAQRPHQQGRPALVLVAAILCDRDVGEHAMMAIDTTTDGFVKR